MKGGLCGGSSFHGPVCVYVCVCVCVCSIIRSAGTLGCVWSRLLVGFPTVLLQLLNRRGEKRGDLTSASEKHRGQMHTLPFLYTLKQDKQLKHIKSHLYL